jgi:hypothetical protein
MQQLVMISRGTHSGPLHFAFALTYTRALTLTRSLAVDRTKCKYNV